MTGSLDEKAWILSQKGPAQYAEEPVFIQPMHTKNADSCTKAGHLPQVAKHLPAAINTNCYGQGKFGIKSLSRT